MIARFFTWLGSLKRTNDALNDELTTIRFENELLRAANRELRLDVRSYQKLASANARFIRVGKARLAALEKAKAKRAREAVR